MKKHQPHNSAIMLITSVAMLANTNFAQDSLPDSIQEILDYMNSPQGVVVTKKSQMLMGASLGVFTISNELVKISVDTTLALPVRQFAQEALLTYDHSATNSYEEIVGFFTTWPFKDETPPPMTTNTIQVMKRSLEIGSSANVHLYNFLCDTNIPSWYREQTGILYTNILQQANE